MRFHQDGYCVLVETRVLIGLFCLMTFNFYKKSIHATMEIDLSKQNGTYKKHLFQKQGWL